MCVVKSKPRPVGLRGSRCLARPLKESTSVLLTSQVDNLNVTGVGGIIMYKRIRINNAKGGNVLLKV